MAASGNVALADLAQLLMVLLYVPYAGACPAFYAEIFPTRVRYTALPSARGRDGTAGHVAGGSGPTAIKACRTSSEHSGEDRRVYRRASWRCVCRPWQRRRAKSPRKNRPPRSTAREIRCGAPDARRTAVPDGGRQLRARVHDRANAPRPPVTQRQPIGRDERGIDIREVKELCRPGRHGAIVRLCAGAFTSQPVRLK